MNMNIGQWSNRSKIIVGVVAVLLVVWIVSAASGSGSGISSQACANVTQAMDNAAVSNTMGDYQSVWQDSYDASDDAMDGGASDTQIGDDTMTLQDDALSAEDGNLANAPTSIGSDINKIRSDC